MFFYSSQAKLEAQLIINKEDSEKRQLRLQKELDTIIKRQRQLESRNRELQNRAVDARNAIHNIDLQDDQYVELKAINEEELSLHDLVAVRKITLT